MNAEAQLAALATRFAPPDQEGQSKVMSLADAVARYVPERSMVHVAYSDARPNAALLEIARRFRGQRPGLTMVTAGVVSSQHALIEAGIVDHVIASFAGENYPMARPNPAFQRAIASGRVTVENWSLWSLTARLVAGALGVPFFPINSMAGSGLAEEHDGSAYVRLDDPFGGDEVGVVRALRPDVVLLQGVAADPHGNVVTAAPFGEGHWGALAARTGVIACVERIVDTAAIREYAALVRIPAHAVVAVCHVPFGSHPYGLHNPGFPGVEGYVPDERFVGDVFEASKDPEAFGRWIDEWVSGTEDHEAYLAKLGPDRLSALGEALGPDGWHRAVRAADIGREDWSDHEMLVVAAAREVESRVLAGGFEAVLAGVGLANLAAWVAVDRLKQDLNPVELMSEIGMFGYRPQPGEPFIFAPRNMPTCKILTDVMTVLGTFVSGPGTCSLGVIGAGEIDAQGDMNSTYTADGRFLVGSGGANDIASATDELLVVIPHGRHRLVEQVPYVTSPGQRVRTVVTSRAVFRRDDGRYRLTAYLPGAGRDATQAVEHIRAGCSWEFDVAADLSPVEPPSPEELTTVRAFDPQRIFLRGRD